MQSAVGLRIYNFTLYATSVATNVAYRPLLVSAFQSAMKYEELTV